MQRIIIFIAVLALFTGCKLDKVEPAQTKAFIKFFGDLGNTEARDLLKLDDGYLLLGTNTYGDTITSTIVKTDLNGNTIWYSPLPDFDGSSLAKSNDSYFIIGDGINGVNIPSSMMLVKTDLNGTIQGFTTIDPDLTGNTNYHGAGVVVSSKNEVVVSFYSDSIGVDNLFLYGYNTELDTAWSEIRNNGVSSTYQTCSNKLFETDNPNEFVWSTLSTTSPGGVKTINLQKAEGDTESWLAGQPLFEGMTAGGAIGGVNTSVFGGVLVQTIDNVDSLVIGLSLIDKTGEEISNAIIISEFGKDDENNVYDFKAHAVVESRDASFFILGSTNYHFRGDESRDDYDLYVTKVGKEGIIDTYGFENIIGGIDEEVGVAAVQADDGGFVSLATMTNTNKVKVMMLVKVNSNGELLN